MIGYPFALALGFKIIPYQFDGYIYGPGFPKKGVPQIIQSSFDHFNSFFLVICGSPKLAED